MAGGHIGLELEGEVTAEYTDLGGPGADGGGSPRR